MYRAVRWELPYDERFKRRHKSNFIACPATDSLVLAPVTKGGQTMLSIALVTIVVAAIVAVAEAESHTVQFINK